MTTELEEQFYKTFGIEPISKWHKCKDYSCVCCDEYDNCSKREFIYPEITGRRLLKMICLIADIHNYSGDVFDIEQNSINELKNFILHFLINYMKTEHTDTFYKNDEVKICVQQLFKEGE